jgi:hypothetical protein
MSSKTSRTFRWALVVSAFAGCALSMLAAIALFTAVVTGHGGSAGNFLRVGLGLLSLFIAIVLLVVGAMNWQSSVRHSNHLVV